MQSSDQDRITRAWDEFVDAGRVFSPASSGERRSVSKERPRRKENISVRQETLSAFLNGDIDVTEFRSRVNQECASSNLWGFSGFSGMMFFNMLVSATEAVPDTNLPETLRSTLSPPSNHEDARAKIKWLVEYVNHLRESLGDDDGSPPAAGSVPYFLSYFWQLDDPDRYPIYYKSMRDALSDLELWAASGDHATDYIAFWELNENFRNVLEEYTGENIHLWDIERLCLFWLNRDILTSPKVWVEKAKPTKWGYGEPGSGFAYAEALWTPQQDSNGRSIYETLREPAVGDIVLHLSIEDDALLGTSVVDSELLTDFDLPEGAMWKETHRERGGYLRELRDYRTLNPRLDIKTDLLRVDRLQPTLRQIAGEHSVFYTESLQLAPQAYVTEAPRELVELMARESPVLRSQLVDRDYKIEIGSAGEYSDINEATEDVRTRLEHQDGQNPLRDSITSALIKEWTSMLTGLEPNSEISIGGEVRGKQILGIYDGAKDDFQAQAAELGIGMLPPLSPAETLFVASFRELQAAFDATANFNQVKYNVLRNESYTVRRSEIGGGTPEGEPLEPAPMPDRGDRIRDLITDVGQLVFYGPPGTGKTYTAQQFARWWLHEVSDDPVQEQLETVTFHPSFSYEDFIEGLTAKETDDGGVAYEIEEGVFKRIAERAREAYQETPDDPAPFILVVDEINRGNLAQIFGETITALEADKRLGADNEVRISLAHSRKSFTVPPNLYVIGTMNTADRSIALVDAALRRRFRFIGFPPNYEALSQAHGFESLHDVEQVAEEDEATYRRLLALSILGVRHLNTRILDAPDLGKGKQIGHSFLWGVESSSDLCTVWQFEILPLLEEYYFGQFERIRDELFQGTGEGLFDYDYEQIREISPARLAAELAPLVGVDSSTVPDTGWAESGKEKSERSLSIHAAIDQGLVEAGDKLVFNEERIPEEATREYDAEDPYWQCEVTGDLGQADNVRWLGGDEGLYSLSGLAKRILNELGDDTQAVNGPIHWCVPEHGNEELRTLVTSAE